MAITKTITSANSVLTLAITNLYPTPQRIEGFAMDSAFTSSDTEIVQGYKGVDGYIAYGYVHSMKETTVEILPNSPAAQIFNDWIGAMNTAREVYVANAILIIPSIKRKFTLVDGAIRSYQSFPALRKVLEPQSFQLMWSEIVGEEIA